VALNPGNTLLNGQYRILRQLGRGGFGFVYLAHDRLLGEEVAIKELIPALVGDDATLKRFLAEAKATMRLAHDHIVRTHNIFSESDDAGDSRFYIVMEYVAGGSLETLLEAHGLLPVDQAVRVAAEICEGLSYAHRWGVVHCDLKPANILFTATGTAKVADFGIAHVSGQVLTRSWMTSAGFAAGTLPYMSPEQTEGARDDPRVDVYALGAVLYRMLTGQPYLTFDQRETPAAQAQNVYRIGQEPPQPPSTHNRRIPAWLDAVVLRALAKRPEDRYADAAALRSALLQRVPGATATPQPGPPARTRPAAVQQRQRTPLPTWFWVLGGGAVTLLVICVLLVVFLVGGGDIGSPASVDPTQVVVIEVTATPSLEAASTGVPTEEAMPTAAPATLLPTLPAASPTEAASPTPTPMPTVTLPPTQTPSPVPTVAPTTPPVDRIAFASNHEGNYEIYALDADGSNRQRLTNTQAEEWHPDWSPDGGRILFQCMQASGASNICAVNADGSGYTQLTQWTKDEAGAQRPVWSPDGAQIAASRQSLGGSNTIWVMNADGSNQRQIADGRDPSWSPDGARIAFIRSDGSGLQIWVIGPDGTNETKLTGGSQDHMYATWSPDGRQLAFEHNHESVAVMDVGGGSPQVIAAKPSWNLSWSPDGGKLVIGPSGQGLWLVNVDGSSLTQISQVGTQPSWRPAR
jgi:serine/threonine protein kinase